MKNRMVRTMRRETRNARLADRIKIKHGDRIKRVIDHGDDELMSAIDDYKNKVAGIGIVGALELVESLGVFLADWKNRQRRRRKIIRAYERYLDDETNQSEQKND